MYACLLLGDIGQLERVLCAAARLVGSISKFDVVLHFMHDLLLWLCVSPQTEFKMFMWAFVPNAECPR